MGEALLAWSYMSWVPKASAPKPVLEEVLLGFQQSQKKGGTLPRLSC